MPDTIAAIATGESVTAIGIIRISGETALTVVDNMFKPTDKTSIKQAKNRHMYHGELKSEDGELIDVCMCAVFRAPNSYTGEDTVELYCHGSQTVLAETLQMLIRHGVRTAKPGEFTKRAFLNGKMDLTQAEAVIDIIEAETLVAAKNAAAQLKGTVGQKVKHIYDSLLDIIAHFHAVIDYPDEDIDEFKMQDYRNALTTSENELRKLLKTHEKGRLLKDGIPTAIVGRANTGKSSVLNALLGYERAIVTDIPGTTRDTIEEKLRVGNNLIHLIDTAGVRETEDKVERLGVERTLSALEKANLVIAVLDASVPLSAEDMEIIKKIPDSTPKIVAINKSDLKQALNTEELEKQKLPICNVSALTGEGIDDLIEEINRQFPEPKQVQTGEIITNQRQAEALAKAAKSLKDAIFAITAAVTPDAVLTDIEIALSAIGELTGSVIKEEVVSRIFERFCVGK
ncbi:MAG: tRNA uridine-5-carboxymethylaminomethyl(34) synthesis GTPase MnmE [Oscillospiraceae bacterium]|nr:tRNA uridine-5-carboxymethylaminomethyl(34) synthesis GTPase MnmE [Oscillospiraceae bacterium]MCL2278048.1 tRNA uridine-5-carboxymethylaminomethyl(34) synthesis GTPase MnmE [Oscillospiraceae bacterium]